MGVMNIWNSRGHPQRPLHSLFDMILLKSVSNWSTLHFRVYIYASYYTLLFGQYES